jgi:two-component system sensor histidine kinase CpxA
MHSLFLKIFLWFWTAMALIGLAFVAVEATTQAEQATVRWRSITGDAFAVYAREAAENFEIKSKEGLAGQELAKYLTQLESRTHIQAWLFDERGYAVPGSTLSAQLSGDNAQIERIRSLAARALGSGQTEFEPQGSTTLAARRADSPDGGRYVLVGQLETARYGFWNTELRVHLLRLVAVLLAASFLCWGLARHLTGPIITLRAVAQRLAVGDLKARAGAELSRRQDELGDLAQDFDRMATRIEALLNEQSQLMQAQRRLLADVSHELRSPLARMGVALDLARDSVEAVAKGVAPDVGLDEVLNRIESEAGRLAQMIARLLTLSRLESGVQEAEMSPIDLASLVRSIVADADFEARSNQRAVRTTICDECTLRGTRDLLRSAIENVVRNALRHTPENTEVEVSIMQDGDRALISVHDWGPGVPEAELQNIFRPFYRVSEARERPGGGEGLGLSITARSVQLHGGDVHAENASNGGLIVKMRLPVMSAQQAPSRAIAAEEIISAA